MGIPNVTYRWSTLKLLYISIFTMNVTGIITVIIMIISAMKLNIGFGNYLNLVTPGDGYLWPALMIVAAILCAPLYVLGIRFCIRFKFKHNFSMEESLRLNKNLFTHIIFCVASIFLTIFINAASIVQSTTFYSRIQNGLLEAMENYGSDVVAKVRIDSIQIEFQCCGSNSYKDWFFIPWKKLGAQSTEKIERIEDADEKSDDNECLVDDVPFSCCLKDILGPCVHDNIMAGSNAYLYDSNDNKLSIATVGCHSKMLSTATLIGNFIVLVLFFLSIYQLVLSILLRLLQTAHSNTFYIGPRKLHYVSWIFGSMPLQKNFDELIDEEEAFLEKDVNELTKDCAPFPQPSSFPQEITSSITLNGYKNTRTQLLRRICSKLSLKLAAANRDGHRLLSSLGISGEKQKEIQEEVEEGDGMTSEEEEWMSPLKKITTAAPPPPSPDFPSEMTSTGKILEACCTSEYSDRVAMNKLKGGVSSQPTNQNKRSGASESSRIRIREFDEGRHSQSGSKISTSSRFVPCKVQLCDTQEIQYETNIPHCPGKSSSAERPWLRSPGSQINSDSEHESQLSDHMKFDTDYNRSIFIKRRGAFNKKENECQQPRQESWSGRQSILRDRIKDPGCRLSPKFNPSDAYNRFRGSIQDTIRRRENQMQARHIKLTSDLNSSTRQSRRTCTVTNCQHTSKLGPMIHHPVSQVQHSLIKNSQLCSFSSPPPPPPPPPLPAPPLTTSISTVKRIPWSSMYKKFSGNPPHWMTMSSVRHTSFSRPAFPQPP